MKPQLSAFEQQQLAARVRQGDAGAFEQLFRLYYASLVHFAARIVGTFSEAEEVVQKVFVNLWQRHTLWVPQASVTAYLYGAVRNEAIKHAQRRPPTVSLEAAEAIVSESMGVDHQLFEHELAGLVERLVGELPEQRRLIFSLSRDHGLSYAEIAQVLDISIKTVETQMGRALRQLRERVRALWNVSF